jgi:hypothetical protein
MRNSTRTSTGRNLGDGSSVGRNSTFVANESAAGSSGTRASGLGINSRALSCRSTRLVYQVLDGWILGVVEDSV